jgi:preprotein translocase subunit SecG
VFGSRGAGNFLTKLTTGAAVTFMATSLLLGYLAADRPEDTLFGEEIEEEAAPAPEAAGEAAEPGAAEGGGFVEVPAPEAAPAPAEAAPAPEAPTQAPAP